jgi:hypothetical protein
MSDESQELDPQETPPQEDPSEDLSWMDQDPREEPAQTSLQAGPPQAPPLDLYLQPQPTAAAGEASAAPSTDPSPAPLQFLVTPRMLPTGAIHLLGGAPMAGKSTFVAQLLRQFVEPDPRFLPGLEFQRLDLSELGIICTDRPWRDNASWFEAVGLSAVPHVAIADDPEILRFMSKPTTSGAPGVDLLRTCLDRLPPTVKVVVADVLTNAFCGNIFQHQIVHRHMAEIQHLLRTRGLTILGTAYGSKLRQGKQERMQRAIDRIIGGSPFRGALSSVLFLEAQEESEHDYQRLTWYSRHHVAQAFALQRDETSGLFFTRMDILNSAFVQPSALPTALPEASKRRRGRPADPARGEKILSLISPGMALGRAELAARAVEAGMVKTTAYTTIQRLVDAHQLALDPDRAVISRPAAEPPKAEEPTQPES